MNQKTFGFPTPGFLIPRLFACKDSFQDRGLRIGFEQPSFASHHKLLAAVEHVLRDELS